MEDLYAFLSMKWGISSTWICVPLAKGLFDLHFNSIEDMVRIGEAGSVLFKPGIFRLRPWSE